MKNMNLRGKTICSWSEVSILQRALWGDLDAPLMKRWDGCVLPQTPFVMTIFSNGQPWPNMLLEASLLDEEKMKDSPRLGFQEDQQNRVFERANYFQDALGLLFLLTKLSLKTDPRLLFLSWSQQRSPPLA